MPTATNGVSVKTMLSSIDLCSSTNAARGLAAASATCSVVSMVFSGAVTASIVAGFVAFVISALIVFNATKVENFESVRTSENALRQEVNGLYKENIKLGGMIRNLNSQVDRLDEVEKGLGCRTAERGTTTARLVELVKDNDDVLEKVKFAVRANLVQTVLSALISSDEDASGLYSDRDIQILELRAKHLPGVKVNHSLLLEKVRSSDCSLQTILQYTQHFGTEDLPRSKRIFMFDEEAFRS